MRSRFLRLSALMLAVLLLALPGCSRGTGKIIRYDIPSGVTTLDPQLAVSQTARMIILNTFEGLFRQDPDGRVRPALAERYEVSEDKLTYTFYLHPDAVWTNGKERTPVTARDFAFALRRLFDRQAPSPYAGELGSIKNAGAILAGKLSPTTLGVAALDDYTLRIQLDRPENLLPELLCQSYAMPCNEAFFLSTRARYGLSLETIQFNGPFYVRGWDNEAAISLRKNPGYLFAETVTAGGVALYIPSAAGDGGGKTDPAVRFLNGSTDACKLDYGYLDTVVEMGGTTASFDDIVWVLILNNRAPPFSQPDLRQAAAYAVDRALFAPYLPPYLHSTGVLIPPAITAAGHSYREYAGDASPMAYSQDLAGRSYLLGLKALEVEKLDPIELMIVDDSTQALLAGTVQGSLQKALSTQVNLLRLPEEELLARAEAGEYTAAILPLYASFSSPDAIFSYFKSGSQQNYAGYDSSRFDEVIKSVASHSGTEQFEIYRQAEQLLLAEGAVIPLYFETSYYAMAPDVEGIAFSPFLSGISFLHAQGSALD